MNEEQAKEIIDQYNKANAELVKIREELTRLSPGDVETNYHTTFGHDGYVAVVYALNRVLGEVTSIDRKLEILMPGFKTSVQTGMDGGK